MEHHATPLEQARQTLADAKHAANAGHYQQAEDRYRTGITHLTQCFSSLTLNDPQRLELATAYYACSVCQRQLGKTDAADASYQAAKQYGYYEASHPSTAATNPPARSLVSTNANTGTQPTDQPPTGYTGAPAPSDTEQREEKNHVSQPNGYLHT